MNIDTGSKFCDCCAMKKLITLILACAPPGLYAQATNAPLALDPQTQALVNALPSKYQMWGTLAVVALMILGRAATSAMTSGGIVPILKSVFMGSVHTQDPVPTPTVVVPAPVLKPVPVPAPIAVKSNP